MNRSLWVDDLRAKPPSYTDHAKTAQEAIRLLQEGGFVKISLDHDLGHVPEAGEPEETGYTVARWLETETLEGRLPKMEILIHTMNPVGYHNIWASVWIISKYWDRRQPDQQFSMEENSTN